jgi:intraflagellar transport protein 88
MAAKLIAPSIEDDIIKGYEWILEQLKSSSYPEAENEIEICKAMAYLKKKNIEKSIETLKGFEKKDKLIMARIATNISFLYFLENDYKNAEKYAEMAINYDRYNAKALVNRGNCLYVKNEFLRAKE